MCACTALHPNCSPLTLFLHSLPYIVCQHLFTFLLFCRFFLLHFEINLRFDAKQLSILTRITPKAQQFSWYIRHRRTLGNRRFCSRLCLALCAVTIGISSSVYWLCFENNNLSAVWYATDTLLVCLPIVGALSIVRKTPAFLDYYLVRREMSIVITCSLVGVAGYVVSIVLLAATHLNELVLMIGILLGASTYSAIALISTLWVLQYSC